MSAHDATPIAAPVRWRRISKCRACGGVLNDVFCDLGAQPLANAYVDPASAPAVDPRIPLRALVCEACRLVQLDTIADASSIFGDYAYLSSVSASWVRHAADFCRVTMARMKPDFVVELASNDGYLLQHSLRRACGVSASSRPPTSPRSRARRVSTRWCASSASMRRTRSPPGTGARP